MKQSEETNELFTALTQAQMEFAPASKTGTNPFFNSSYATLTDILQATMPVLASHGLALLQLTEVDEKPVLVTQICHKSGQWIRGEYPIICKDNSDPQKFGAAVTYAKRYALQAALGVPTEDDDGNTAAKPLYQPKKDTYKPASPANKLHVDPRTEDQYYSNSTQQPDKRPPADRYVWPWGRKKGEALRDFSPTDLSLAKDWLEGIDDPKPMHDEALENVNQVLGL